MMNISRLVSVAIAICLAPFANAVTITGPQGGVNTTTGQRPFRQEFSTFKNSGPAFDLYILALQQFQQQNQSALLSYYQVSGRLYQCCMYDHYLLVVQEVMGIHISVGMVSKVLTKRATARMAPYCFRHGIDPTWRSLR